MAYVLRRDELDDEGRVKFDEWLFSPAHPVGPDADLRRALGV